MRRASHHQRVIAAGPWSFPAPSSVLPVTRRTLEGTDCPPSSSHRHLAVMEHRGPAPAVLAPLQSFADSPRSVNRPPLLGFVRSEHTPGIAARCVSADLIAPSSTCSFASTPGPMSPPRLRPLVNQTRSPVPTSWFRTTSSVCSARSRGLVASRCQSWGSTRFRSGRPVTRPPVPFPRRSYPSKDSTHPQPYRVTTALALLTFTRRAARASRVRVAAPALLRASRFELAFKALLCR